MTKNVFIPQDEYPIYIKSDFGETISEIGYIFLATNEQNVVPISNGKISLLHGRMYYIPINNTQIDSDLYTIKVHSDVADRIDVRFVKDGFACVIPIRHNASIKNGEKLCVLFPLR